MRKIKFENDKYYHIYNRGVDKREIFLDDKDFIRFIISMREFNVVEPIGSLYDDYLRKKREAGGNPISKLEIGFPPASARQPLVDFICYCLNSNHYHFILKQKVDNGVIKLMQRLGIGYSKYFNNKYFRVGALFQGKYKVKNIDTAKYLVWASAYVNGNVEIHKLAEAKDYQWSSCKDYLNLRNGTLCDKDIAMNEFDSNAGEYEKFVEAVIKDCQMRKEAAKKYLEGLD